MAKPPRWPRACQYFGASTLLKCRTPHVVVLAPPTSWGVGGTVRRRPVSGRWQYCMSWRGRGCRFGRTASANSPTRLTRPSRAGIARICISFCSPMAHGRPARIRRFRPGIHRRRAHQAQHADAGRAVPVRVRFRGRLVASVHSGPDADRSNCSARGRSHPAVAVLGMGNDP